MSQPTLVIKTILKQYIKFLLHDLSGMMKSNILGDGRLKSFQPLGNGSLGNPNFPGNLRNTETIPT